MQKSKFRKAKLIEEKEKEGGSYALISKGREILAVEEKLKRKKGAYSDLAKRLMCLTVRSEERREAHAR